MRGTSRISALVVFTILLVAVVSCNRADEKWVSDTSGVSIMVPGDHGWKTEPPHGDVKVGVQRRGRLSGAMVSYSEMPQKGPVTVTQKGGEAWEAHYLKRSSGTKVSGSMTTFHGRPAYEFEEKRAEKDVDGVEVRTKAILCSTGNALFSIWASTISRGDPGDPLQDPVIKRFVDSIQIPDSSQSLTAAH
jgi:hypothetical protein